MAGAGERATGDAAEPPGAPPYRPGADGPFDLVLQPPLPLAPAVLATLLGAALIGIEGALEILAVRLPDAIARVAPGIAIGALGVILAAVLLYLGLVLHLDRAQSRALGGVLVVLAALAIPSGAGFLFGSALVFFAGLYAMTRVPRARYALVPHHACSTPTHSARLTAEEQAVCPRCGFRFSQW
jgi:hypothetical protein